MEDRNGINKRLRSYFILMVFLAILVLIIWLGLYLYSNSMKDFGFFLAGRLDMSTSALILFAFLAGVVSFFSPCAFPLLPAYATYYISLEEEDGVNNKRKVKTALYLGLVATSGLMILYSGIGILLGIFGSTMKTMSVFITFLIVGVIIMILGVLLLSNHSFNLTILNRFWRERFRKGKDDDSTTRKVFLYGVGYGLAAMGCTLPILLALMIYSMVAGGLIITFIVFLVYSLAMGLLMVMVTILVALSKDVLINKLKASTVLIKKASGIILVVIGIYMVIYFFLG